MSGKREEMGWELDLRLLREVFKESQQQQHLHILVVEDCDEDFFLLARCLNAMQEFEVSITHARDLDEAVEQAEEKAFDLVIVDFWLGDQTGPNVLAKLGGRHGAAPAILVTGLDHPAYKAAGLKAGAIQSISKDLLTSTLLQDTIRSVCLTHKIEKDLVGEKRT